MINLVVLSLMGIMFAAVLSLIQLGELNVWSLAVGSQLDALLGALLGALMLIVSALIDYTPEADD